MVETYTRLLLLAPHAPFRSHFSSLAQRNPTVLSKPGVTLLGLEILNYRLRPLYRYEGQHKGLMYDVTKIMHHVIHYEGQGGPVQSNSKPRPEVLALLGRASESLRPDINHLFSHLKADVSCSIYAATHPTLAQNP